MPIRPAQPLLPLPLQNLVDSEVERIQAVIQHVMTSTATSSSSSLSVSLPSSITRPALSGEVSYRIRIVTCSATVYAELCTSQTNIFFFFCPKSTLSTTICLKSTLSTTIPLNHQLSTTIPSQLGLLSTPARTPFWFAGTNWSTGDGDKRDECGVSIFSSERIWDVCGRRGEE